MPPYNIFEFQFIGTDNTLTINTYALSLLSKMVRNINDWKLIS